MTLLETTLQGQLIVSCQPLDDSPMNLPDIVLSMALAAQIGGAGGLRIEGLENLILVRAKTKLPIIGLIKRDLEDSSIRITPFISDIKDLASAGADIIAYDATQRLRPETTCTLVNEIINNGCIAMADCASLADAKLAIEQGAKIIGTTLSGYAYKKALADAEPDFDLISKFSELDVFVMAEGRFNSPQYAAKAMLAGANAVTVGSAITRVENITTWFVDEINNTQNKEL